MQLYFIRHAESENNALYARTGSWEGRSPDPALTDTGRRQAERLAAFLARGSGGPPDDRHNRHGFGITHLYCSLMLRSVTTGDYVAQALGLPLVAWEVIHERGGIFGRDEETGERIGLAGATREEFEQQFPRLVLPETMPAAGWWDRPAESWDETLERARRFLKDLVQRHGGSEDRVAIISHGGFYHDMMLNLLGTADAESGLEQPSRFWFGLNNTGISRIEFGSEELIIAYLNRVDHLETELIT